MSQLVLVQQFFSEIFKMANLDGGRLPNVNLTSSDASRSSNSSSSLPTDLPSLIFFLFSFSALREWLKLFLLGSALESLRRIVFYTYKKFYESFFITAVFDEEDHSYNWMCYWLSCQPTWRLARDVQVSTSNFGLGKTAVETEYDDDSDDEDSPLVPGPIAYLPSQGVVHTMWYKGHWMRVSRYTLDAANGIRDHRLEIRILTRTHNLLNALLVEARQAYMKAKANCITIYVSDYSDRWKRIGSRPKRPLSSIILDAGVKDSVVADAKDFLTSKAWYVARGIPFRRGYLLYGAPGTGKSSLIHSLAGELGLDVYIITLSKAGLDDTGLSGLISLLPEKSIALMEDIDVAFSQTLNRDSSGPAGPAEDEDSEYEDEDGTGDKSGNRKGDPPQDGRQRNMQARPTSRITLSGLLNALDGVAAQEGRILFATTNKYDSLDAALCRPGRMDIHIEFKLASRQQARELFLCFYMPDNGHQEPEEKGRDSGYTSDSDEKTRLNDEEEENGRRGEPPAFVGTLHTTRGNVSTAKTRALADEFADCIPEREFSMASLQGYLMGYKVRPVDAVRDVRGWVEKGRTKGAKRTKAT